MPPQGLLAALMGGQGAPAQPPQMPQMPMMGSAPQAARHAVIGMLGVPTEGQGQAPAVAPQGLPASTLHQWGYDPRHAKGGS